MNLHLGGSPFLLLAWLPLAWLAWYTYRRTRPPASGRGRLLLIALRTSVVGLLLLLLAEPQCERRDRSIIRPRVLVLIDSSGSMGVSEGDSTRFQRVWRTLATDGLLRALQAAAEVSAWRFDVAAEPVALDTLESVRPVGKGTDISGALVAALEGVERRSELDAVIVISDGRHNVGTSPVHAAASAGIPVYGLSVGSAAHPADVQIAAVQLPAVAYAGQDVTVELDLRSWGYGGRDVEMALVESDVTHSRARVTLPEDGERVRAAMSIRAGSPGTHVCRAVVQPLPGEVAVDNNEAVVVLDVRRERVRVLLLADAPGAELAFMRRTLAADPGLAVEVRADLLRPGETPDSGLLLAGIRGADAVVLVDPGTRLWREELVRELGEWVEQGGGLLFMYGPRALSVAGGRGTWSWLPAQPSGQVAWVAQPVQVRLGAGASRHPAVLHPEGGGESDLWQRIPPLSGFVAGLQPAAGTTVLLAGADPAEVPLLVAGQFGLGRVLVALSSGFWRQDLLASGVGHDSRVVRAFWRDVVRWLGTRDSGAGLRAWTEKRVYRSGDRVSFGAQVNDELCRPREGALVTASISPGDVLVRLGEHGPGVHRGAWSGLDPGEYTFVAAARVGDELIGEDRGGFIVEPYSLESGDVRADSGMLAQIARASGGATAPLSRWSELLARLPLQARIEERQQSAGLWPRAWCLGLLLVLVIVEWTLRKQYGMI